MRIVILCNQVDCMHNTCDINRIIYETNICMFKHPVFYQAGKNRHCTSKCVKHTKCDKSRKVKPIDDNNE